MSSEPQTPAAPPTPPPSPDHFPFFRPYDELDIAERNLPHWHQDRVWYFVTFRQADSLPQTLLTQFKNERAEWLARNAPDGQTADSLTPEQYKEYIELFPKRMQNWLDQGIGTCRLRDARAAEIVADALLFFDGQRYELDSFVVMPNHVHALLCLRPEYHLPDILHSWKSFTSWRINKLFGLHGQFWKEESYDHIVRNAQALDQLPNSS